MKKIFNVLASAVSIAVLFLSCSNPIVETWWALNDNSGTTNTNREFFIVSFNPGPDCKDWVGPQSIIRDGKVERVPAITQPGFVFGGWFPNSSRSGNAWDFDNDIVVRDFTLFAKWVPVPYTVVFNSSGGNPQPPNQVLIHGTKVKEPPPMENSSQGFGGWYTVNGTPWLESNRWNFETPVTNDNTTAEGVLNLYARWAASSVTVIFYENGGEPEVSDQHIIYGQKVQPPPPITPKDDSNFNGFVFGGWLTDPGNTNTLWDFDTVVNGTTVPGAIPDAVSNATLSLHALWIPVPVSVTFITNGGTPIPQAQAVLTGAPVREPRQISRAGYAFAGWYKNTGEIWDFANELVNQSMFLYAKWEEEGFTVKFEADGGSPAPADQFAADGGKVQEPLPMFKDNDYGFGGWYTEKPITPGGWDEGKRWHFASDTVDEDITLYARWDENEYYTVEFVSNTFDTLGPIYMVLPQIVAQGTCAVMPRPMIQEGKNFIGWYTVQPMTSGVLDPDGIWDEDNRWVFSKPVNSDMILYARWEKVRYVVLFNPIGGEPDPGFQYVLSESKAQRPLPMVKPGYSFDGWFTNDTSIREWDFSSPVTSDMTLHAKWISIPTIYTVNFVFNDGTTDPQWQYIVSGATAGEPPTPVREGNPEDPLGFGFGGWYTDYPKTPEGYLDPDGDWDDYYRWHFGIPVTENMSLHARWDKITSRIFFQANEGREEPAEQIIARGTRVTQPVAMERSNHYFAGWYANQRFEGLPWDFVNGFVNTQELTLYARWIHNDVPPIEIVQRVRIYGIYYVDFAGNQTEFNNPRPGAGASTALTSTQVSNNLSAVQSVVNIMLQHPEFIIQLSGHANPTENTPEEYAQLEVISTARSQSVLDEFISRGIKPASMINAGYNDRIYGDGSHGSLNRCVEIIIIEYLPLK